MKQLSVGFANHINGEATSICRCWILETKSGLRLGFTDHDQDILLQGVKCEGSAGMETSAIEERLGFSANTSETSGALSSDKISDDDVSAGVYDGAKVHTYIVNWSEPDQYVLDRVTLVGEIIREDGLYRMEMLGLTSILDQTQGRHFVSRCQADLGDERCKVNLETSKYQSSGIILEVVSSEVFLVSGLGDYASGWFRSGQLIWTSGVNDGHKIEILDHTKSGSSDRVVLWQPMPRSVELGDGFKVIAGCNRDFQTCKSKFSNALNYQGFPHMPGNRFALGYVGNTDIFDGGPIVL